MRMSRRSGWKLRTASLAHWGLLVSAAFSGALAASFANAESSGAGAQFEIDTHPQGITVNARAADAAHLAEAIGRETGLRIDGARHLRGSERVTLEFDQPVEPQLLLGLLAQAANVELQRSGPRHYAFTSAEQAAHYRMLVADLDRAYRKDDLAAIQPAENALLDFIRPAQDGPVWLHATPWFDAATRAEAKQDYVRAEALLREGITHLARRDDARGADYGVALGQLGLLLRDRQMEGAAPLLEEGLSVASAELGPIHPRLARLQLMLAQARLESDRLGDARRLFEQAIQSYEQGAEEHITWFGLALQGLASVHVRQGRLADAEPLLRRNYEMHRDALGADGADFQAWYLAHVLFRQDKLADAEPLLRQGVARNGSRAARMRVQLEALERLVPLSGPAHDADALQALRQALSASVARDVLLEMLSVLEVRAQRQYREAPTSPAWRTSCIAIAEVMAARDAPELRDDAAMRNRLIEQCAHRLQAAASTQGVR